MADIRPFYGWHYNQALVKDRAAVICPPYDIITPQMQQELLRRSEYNFVRLEFGEEFPQDTTTNNRYTRASATLKQWLREGVLKAEETPAIYLHDHHFTHGGQAYRRRGIMAAVKLEEWSKMVIRPHEGTLSQPKSDRLSLLWALQANTSAVLALFDDKERKVSPVLASESRHKPVLKTRPLNGESHIIWAITKPEAVNRIRRSLAGQPLYIADGHHRYESALTYQRERRACSPPPAGEQPFDFVMMTLVDLADPGLVILPAHRLVRGIPEATRRSFKTSLKTLFEIEELSMYTPDLWQRVDSLQQEEDKTSFIIYGLTEDNLLLLKLRDPAAASQMMPYFHSELYKKLDVSIVDHVILEKILGLNLQNEGAFLSYSYDREDAVNKVRKQEYQLVFLLKPVRAETIKAIADAADRMPRKSTYFYPKLPSGLIMYRLAE